MLFVRGAGGQSVRVQPPDPEVLDCEPESTQVSLEWQHDREALTGCVDVINSSRRPCRVAGKPVITPLGQDGIPLKVKHIVTLEMRIPGYVVLRPGQRARAGISWAGWPGPAAGRDILVRIGTWQTKVTATGPSQPQGVRGPTNTSSTWFELTT